MRILFVVDYTGDEYIGIMSISSVLKQRGYQVEMVEAEYNRVGEKLRDNIPTILAYSTPTMLVDYYLRLNKRIKENFKVFSVFGGPHPTAVPEMVEEEGVDGVCIGEGEFAMLELVDDIGADKPIRNIKNWWIKENGKIFKNPLRPLVKDLDTLPFPDRDLFKNKFLFDKEKIHIITGRGCPYKCTFCFNPHYNQLYNGQAAIVRKRSVKNIIEEIKWFRKKYPLKSVVFDDDIFILPYEWLKEFSRQYKRYVNLPFFCNVRADNINSQVVKYLKNAGCYSISMGLETADDYLRNDFLNKNITKDQIITVATLIKKQKIRLKTSNIIGISRGTLYNDLETMKLNIKCNVDYASVNMLVFYPKTEIRKSMNRNEQNNSLFFSLENNPERRLIENLRYFFALTVQYPFLFRLVKILIRLPLHRLYKFFYLFWEGYCAYFRLYPAGIRDFLRGGRKYINLLRNQKHKNREYDFF